MQADSVQTEGVQAVSAAPSGTSIVGRMHPLGWVALGLVVIALVFHTVFSTKYLVGNLSIGHWVALLLTVAISTQTNLLDRIRRSIDSISSVTKVLAWILVWIVFIVQFFNVATRYGNGLVETDIYFGETVSVAWQAFALIAILGLNYGVRDGVNPRIDFWWADFSNKTKATLDFTIHVLLLLPFTFMAIRLLNGYATTALGRTRSGEWPSGWRVWETWEGAPDAGSLAVGPIKALLLVAFTLFALQVISEVIKTGFVLVGREDLGAMSHSDAPMRIE